MALQLSGELRDSDVVEIRVHGVSNTPPESTLGVAPGEVRRIAGDEQTGIYEPKHELTADHLVRAYSWGQLTSGQRLKKDLYRGLWMVLLPFSFANVSIWAQPTLKGEHSNAKSQTTGAVAALCRLFCLSLTVTLTLGVLGVSLNLMAWQWATQQGAGGIFWLTFVHHGWFSYGTRPIAVGTAFAMGVMLLIRYVAHRSFQYEAEVSAVRIAEEERLDPTNTDLFSHPMESRWFWRGGNQAYSLSSLHIAVALSAAGLFGLVPVLLADNRSDEIGWESAGAVLVAAFVVAAVGACLQIATPAMTTRGDLAATPWPRLVRLLAEVAAALTLIFLLDTPLDPNLGRALPGFSAACAWLGIGQWIVIAVLAVVVYLRARGMAPEQRQPIAWHGMGSALMLSVGWLLAMLYSLAAMYYCADYLDGRGNPVGTNRSLALPLAFQWAAVGVVAGIAIAVIVAIVKLAPIPGQASPLVDEIIDAYGGQRTSHRLGRARSVAKQRAYRAFLQDRMLGTVGLLVLLMELMVFVLVLLTALQQPVDGRLALVAVLGARLLLWLGIALAWVAASVYRDGEIRRVVGIVWDIMTFWPRVGHPWAPPCYAERCVPQLATLIGNRKPGPGFILAGHSQGSTISAATVLQLPPSHRSRVYFVTFGTQLQKFYGRAFPAVFGPDDLTYLATTMHPSTTDDTRQQDHLRWRSLWRKTDPIGYRIDVSIPCDVASHGLHSVDNDGSGTPTPFVDPANLDPPVDDFLDPPMHGHSDYPADHNFDIIMSRAAAVLREH